MKTVLVIEDNVDNMVLATRLLKKAECHVLQAETGVKGYEMFLENQVDLILLDIQLPDINGAEVLRMIRALDGGKQVNVVAVTSYAMAGDRERLLEAGCNAYIEKPIDPVGFIEKIKGLLGEASQQYS
jgi:two-component system cell cycle response regulator DivK